MQRTKDREAGNLPRNVGIPSGSKCAAQGFIQALRIQAFRACTRELDVLSMWCSRLATANVLLCGDRCAVSRMCIQCLQYTDGGGFLVSCLPLVTLSVFNYLNY